MRKYLLRTSILALTLVIPLSIGELYMRSLTLNQFTYKHNYMMEHSHDIQTLILGSSHTYFGVNPKYLDANVFNLANQWQSVAIDLKLLKNYGEYMPNLQMVILPISYQTLGYPNIENSWKVINYNIYMDSKIKCDVRYNFAIFSPKFCSMKLSSNNQINCDSLGYGLATHIDKKNLKKWDSTATVEAHSYPTISNIKRNKQLIGDIIEYCKNKSIRLVFITTPTWHTYYDNMNVNQYKDMLNLIESFQSEYGVEYYNFIDDNRFQTDDFYDTDHLSNIGAKKFSIILNDTLNLKSLK